MFYGGAEAAVKFSKDYGNRRNRLLGLDGLLHVTQPYVNWSVLAVTNWILIIRKSTG